MDALRALREARHLTQNQVAANLGVSRSTYAKWEISEREPDKAALLSIADLFGVTIDFLLGRPSAMVSFAPDTSDDPTENMRVAMEHALKRPVDREDAETLLEAYDRLTKPKNLTPRPQQP
jgi:transcriptional regulator with XRE-family HTH domain